MQSCRSLLALFTFKTKNEEQQPILAERNKGSELQSSSSLKPTLFVNKTSLNKELELKLAIYKLAAKFKLTDSNKVDEFDVADFVNQPFLLLQAENGSSACCSYGPRDPICSVSTGLFVLFSFSGVMLKSYSIMSDGHNCQKDPMNYTQELIDQCISEEKVDSANYDIASKVMFGLTGAVVFIIGTHLLSKKVESYQLEKLEKLCNDYKSLLPEKKRNSPVNKLSCV